MVIGKSTRTFFSSFPLKTLLLHIVYIFILLIVFFLLFFSSLTSSSSSATHCLLPLHLLLIVFFLFIFFSPLSSSSSYSNQYGGALALATGLATDLWGLVSMATCMSVASDWLMLTTMTRSKIKLRMRTLNLLY